MSHADPPRAEQCPSADDPVELLRLHLATLYQAGLGRGLLERFGSVRAVLRSDPARLRETPGMKSSALERLLSRSVEKAALDEMARARSLGVTILGWGSPAYPDALRELSAAPIALYAQGRPEILASGGGAVGVVGSRRPTPYGLAQAQRFAGALSMRGITVVSGMALGIDGEAHRAALDAGGLTIAVLGSGLGRVYPGAHRHLAERIVQSRRGLLLSEFSLSAAPRSFHFPMRNRILSGLSDAVLVIEAGEKSGSLITVTHALEQGKLVYALPGRVDRPESLGCLRLLMDGATPVMAPEDVLPGARAGMALPDPGAASGRGTAAVRLPGKFGERLVELFGIEDAWRPDDLARRLESPAQEVLRELSRLELNGFLRRLPGGAFALSQDFRGNGACNAEGPGH